MTAAPIVVHDLGSGTGSMMRWLAPLLPGPQTWVLHDIERKPLFTEESIASWIGQNGGDAAKFREAFNSFSVSQKSARAEQLSRDYRVSGVPQVVVAGKYAVMANSYDDMLRISSELIEQERSAAGAKRAN